MKATTIIFMFFFSAMAAQNECYTQISTGTVVCKVDGRTLDISAIKRKGMSVIFLDDCYNKDGQLAIVPYRCGKNDKEISTDVQCYKPSKKALYSVSVECRNGKGVESIYYPIKRLSQSEVNQWFNAERR